MEQLSPKEADIALQFLNRVDLKGSESEAHAFIKSKLMAIRDGRETPKNVSEMGKANET